jgi:hypothetical protein
MLILTYIIRTKEVVTYFWNTFLWVQKFVRSVHVIKPIKMATLSTAWTIFARSNTGIVGSNPTQSMDICVRLFFICIVLCVGSCWSSVQGVPPTVYKIKKLKKRPRSNKEL